MLPLAGLAALSMLATGPAPAEGGPYVDPTDIWKAVGLGGEESPVPKPFQPVPAVLPAVGYNPAAGL